ncbi:MAG: hypothetical protein ACPH5K_02315 [Polaribacter sp.]
MIKKFLVLFTLLISTSFLAQRTSLSPYSFFGIGEEFSPVTVEQASMGGIGVAFSHYKYLNFTNPAAIANLRYTTYGFGGTHKELKLKSATSTQSSSLTTFNYVGIGFPIGKKAGFGVGIQPVSSVGYELENTILDANGDITELSLFEGNGGVNRIYFNLGFLLFKDLALGAKASFNFGNINNTIIDQRVGLSLGTKYEEITQVRGSAIQLGAQYKKAVKDDLTITAGAAVKLSNEMRVNGDDYLYSVILLGAAQIPRDTLSTSGISGTFQMPLKSTLGIGIGKTDKWYAGVEYETQDAYQTSGFLSTTNTAFRYGNSNRIGIGGFYIPKINSISSYFDRITYRFGIRMENTGLLVDGSGTNSNFSEIKDFGISFGLGIPLKRLSTMNVGFEYGKRGSTDNNLIQENYLNLRLSLSLTDVNWFIKRRID